MAAALRAVVYTLHYLATWWARPFPTAHNHAAPLFVAAMSTSGRHVLSPTHCVGVDSRAFCICVCVCLVWWL